VRAKLNQTEILRELLRTLVAGWGIGRVRDALDALEAESDEAPKTARPRRAQSDAQRGSAVALAEDLDLAPERKTLILALARAYDDESAFPTLGDARAFLLSHNRDAKDIKTRPQAFRRLLPLLTSMSEKGLETAIARSRHSGPAKLDAISKAIRDAGETMRGSPNPDAALRQNNHPDDSEAAPAKTKESTIEMASEPTGSKHSTERQRRKHRRDWTSPKRRTP
jgi:hypothetical protein